MTKDFDKKLFKAIFDSYFKFNYSNNKITLWLCNTLMRLMNLLEATKNKALIKDAIIIALNLMKEIPLDPYEFNTKDLKNMTLNNQIEAKFLLKKVWDFN